MLLPLLAIIYALVMALMLTHATVTLAWMVYTWRSPQATRKTGFEMTRRQPKHFFTLMVPARHEGEVLGDTLDHIAEADYPDFEVLVV